MSQVFVKPFSLGSHPSLEDWFAGIQHHPGSVLLHSGDAAHENAQYHIATGFPLLSIQLFADGRITHSKLSDHNTDFETLAYQKLDKVCGDLDDSPVVPEQLIDRVQEIQAHLFADHRCIAPELPFQCGAIGFAGYDFGRFIEQLPDTAMDEYQTPVFTVYFYSWCVLQDTATQDCWLCYSSQFSHPDFNEVTTPSTGLQHRQDCAEKTPANVHFALTSKWQSNMSEAAYTEKLARIHEYLLSGDCYQVNLAQRFKASYVGNEWSAWQALSEANQAPFSAFIRTEQSCIISCSPERFLSVHDGIIETKPIKGTRPRFTDPGQDQQSKEALINSEKDQAENLMIVDLLRNDISKNAMPHSVEVTGLFDIESFSSVHHMVSTIRAKLKPESHPLTLLQDAFPGGSITGAPKIRAMEIIDELEPHRRNIYCGSVFFVGVNGDFDSSICIRTLLFEANSVYCWAGGGIVADSDSQAEYQETFHKVNKILPVLSALKETR